MVDPDRCPLCGEPNRCAAESGERCWCFDVEVSSRLLAAVPDEARGRACVCRACVERHAAASRSGLPMAPEGADPSS